MAGPDKSVCLIDQPGYAVIATDSALAKKYAKKQAGGLDEQLSKETAAAFLEGDMSVYVNVKTVVAAYGEQIKAFKELIDGLFAMDGLAGLDKGQAEAIRDVVEGVMQMLTDGVAFVVAAKFDEDGARLKLHAQFGPDTETNKFLKRMKPAKLSEIGGLPAGLALYTASNIDFRASKTFAKLTAGLAADDKDEKVKEQIEAIMRELAGYDQGVEASGGNMKSLNGLEVTPSKDAAKVVAARIRLMRTLTADSSFASVPLKSKPEVKDDAEKVGELSFASVKLAFDLDKAVEAAGPDVKELTKKSLMKTVGEGTTRWIGTDGKLVYEVTAKDWKEAKALIEGYVGGKSAVEKEEAYKLTRKSLPAEASMLVLFDAVKTAQAIADLFRDQLGGIPGAPLQIPELKAPPGKPAYVGLAVVLKAEYGSLDLFVPTAAVQQIRRLLAPVIDGDN